MSNKFFSVSEFSSLSFDDVNFAFPVLEGGDFNPSAPDRRTYSSDKPIVCVEHTDSNGMDGCGIGFTTPWLRTPFGFTVFDYENPETGITKTLRSLALSLDPAQKFFSLPNGKPLEQMNNLLKFQELLQTQLYQWTENLCAELSATYDFEKHGVRAVPRTLVKTKLNSYTNVDENYLNVNFARSLFDFKFNYKGACTQFDFKTRERKEIALTEIQGGDFVRIGLFVKNAYMTWDPLTSTWTVGISLRPDQLEVVPGNRMEALPDTNVFGADELFDEFFGKQVTSAVPHSRPTTASSDDGVQSQSAGKKQRVE